MGSVSPTMILSALETGASLVQNQRAAKAQSQAQAAASQARIRQIEQARQIEARRKKDQLRRALATQRAGFGAAGVGSRGGSASALLDGLQKKVDADLAEGSSLAQERIADINRQMADGRRQNLLTASSRRNQLLFGLLERSLPGLSLLER